MLFLRKMPLWILPRCTFPLRVQTPQLPQVLLREVLCDLSLNSFVMALILVPNKQSLAFGTGSLASIYRETRGSYLQYLHLCSLLWSFFSIGLFCVSLFPLEVWVVSSIELFATNASHPVVVMVHYHAATRTYPKLWFLQDLYLLSISWSQTFTISIFHCLLDKEP